MSDATRLKDMNLHDIINFGPAEVMRVPGGWIYYAPHGNVFVPINYEFSNKEFLEKLA